MGSMTLAEYRTDIRVELSDSGSFFSDAEIDRGVEKTESLLARSIPKKNIYEATYTAAGSETLTIASSTGTLGTIPVKYDSETLVDSSSVTQTRNTDYTINYQTGVVTEIGALLPDGDYTATYTVDPKRIDITSAITDPIRITRIEYPVGNQPPTYLGSFDWVFNTIILHGDDLLSDGRNYRIYYDSKWTGATASVDGDYPEHLDDAVVVGAAGQTLIFKAEKYVQSAVTEIGLVNSAADSMATPLADINAALDKVALYLETNDTTDNAKDVLANITDDIANLRTAIATAHTAANAYLDEVDTTDFADATYGAEKMLKHPVDDTLINVVTVGEKVTTKYATLSAGHIGIASARISAALAFVEEANSRLSNIRTYIEEAGGWNRIAEDFIAEAAQRVAEVSGWAAQADRYETTTRYYLDIAGRYLASGQAKINEFYAMIGVKPELQHGRATSPQATKY